MRNLKMKLILILNKTVYYLVMTYKKNIFFTGQPPCVAAAFEQRTVHVGESVTIPCPLSSPGGSLQWLQNGAAVVLDSSASRRRQWTISPDGTAALSIVNARRSDAGRWECRELAVDGSVRKVADVMELVVGSK